MPRGRPPEIIEDPEADPFDDLDDAPALRPPFTNEGVIALYPPPAWEELTSTEAGVLLRHDGQLYVAVLVNVDTVISTTLGGHTE